MLQHKSVTFVETSCAEHKMRAAMSKLTSSVALHPFQAPSEAPPWRAACRVLADEADFAEVHLQVVRILIDNRAQLTYLDATRNTY